MEREQTAEEIARWMLAELEASGRLEQDRAVAHILSRYGDSYLYRHENGNVSIDKDVKKRFKKLHGGRAAWERDGFFWAWT
ncbi:hypothetical protein I8J29_15900 [Paenibacillus sp. MWE-103]|uniref:Integron gene cassette protein n=1 Tax=Paenibacillus artemisiicola TaxID=1172618 RepID=A0ABS3WBK3_9BACL|nr:MULTISPECIES: hypothetical protein [Paenibacillus]MBO7745695.1 hypothetical protein [Paenibacillus artemisiicola]SFI77204.1 hypothetical protein SAMN02799624_02110 [Paenibacillus sp. UNC496MF]